MTPNQEMELLLAEAKRKSSIADLELLVKEAERQNMSDLCQTCGRESHHPGWMLCLDTRLSQRKEDMKNQKSQTMVAVPPESGRQEPPANRAATVIDDINPAGGKPSRRDRKPRDTGGHGQAPSAGGKSGQGGSPGESQAATRAAKQTAHGGAFLTRLGRKLTFGPRLAVHLLAVAVIGSVMAFLGLLGLIQHGVIRVAKGVLWGLKLVATAVFAVGKGVLMALKLLAAAVVGAVGAVHRAFRLLAGALVQGAKKVLAMLASLFRAAKATAIRTIAILAVVVSPALALFRVFRRLAKKAGKRGQELLEQTGETIGRMLPSRQSTPKSIGVITSPGGPQVSHRASPEALVLITSGLDQGRSFPVGEHPVTIGSAEDCDIRLPAAPGLAAVHARLWWRDGQRMLHHLAPDQATIVSGRSVIWISLQEGDEAFFGPYSLRLSSSPVGVAA